MIIDGKIGLKNDSVIKEFTKTGLKFEDGSTLDTDLVIFATGFGDYRDGFRKLLSEELGSKVKQIWGLDDACEVKGAWRDLGVDNLWCMMGNLAMCRYYSRHVALREFSLIVSFLRRGFDNRGPHRNQSYERRVVHREILIGGKEGLRKGLGLAKVSLFVRVNRRKKRNHTRSLSSWSHKVVHMTPWPDVHLHNRV